jgi:hypothetical protein
MHVAGKNADDLGSQCGGWTISWQGDTGSITEGTTILEAIREVVPANNVTFTVDGTVSEGADVGIAVIGELPYAEGAGDRTDLQLSTGDIAAVRNLKKAGLKVVTILISGRPMILEPILHYTDVLFAAWLPGTEGLGVADILFGDVEPQGRLSHSWPQNMAQVPINIGDENYDPLYAYDYGLTSFEDSESGSAPEVLSAATTIDRTKIEVSFNKAMIDPSASANSFSVQSALQEEYSITAAALKSNDPTTIELSLSSPVAASDDIAISYTQGTLMSGDSGVLPSFEMLAVYDVLSELSNLPGKIEGEDFSDMSGVQTENTSDAGGGLNVGWIDDGDWMDYQINVLSSGPTMYSSESPVNGVPASSKFNPIIRRCHPSGYR